MIVYLLIYLEIIRWKHFFINKVEKYGMQVRIDEEFSSK